MRTLASSRRYSLAVAATAALALPGINRQELTLALAEWRALEPDATVRGVLGTVLAPVARFVSPIELDPVLNAERN